MPVTNLPTIPAPGENPSYECLRPHLDASFQKKVDGKVFAHNRFDGRVIGGGPDAYAAQSSVENMTEIGRVRAKQLKEFFGITTIGELSRYDKEFITPLNAVVPKDFEDSLAVFRAKRAAAQTCKLEQAPLGRALTIEAGRDENDPALDVYITPGRDVVKHNQGRNGYAEFTLWDNPSNNGVVASWLNVNLSGYEVEGRGGATLQFDPIKVEIGPGLPDTNVELGEALKRAFEEKGLACSFERVPEFHNGISRNPVRVRVWSDLAVDRVIG